jgi:pimeloyl-ACP methyl ester carboxylesterase
MTIQLVGFHGYTLKGAWLRYAMRPLLVRLQSVVEPVFPDAPHECDPKAVDVAYAAWRVERPPPPHLTWWRASEAGRIYAGWEETREFVRELLVRHGPALLFGFSQGAMLAATAAALSARGEFPAIRGVILVAGAPPRAEALAPLFETPIAVPSLHVWGDRDSMARHTAPRLVQCFAPELRTWLNRHYAS